jgi:hypothetical protein
MFGMAMAFSHSDIVEDNLFDTGYTIRAFDEVVSHFRSDQFGQMFMLGHCIDFLWRQAGQFDDFLVS